MATSHMLEPILSLALVLAYHRANPTGTFNRVLNGTHFAARILALVPAVGGGVGGGVGEAVRVIR